MDITRDWSGIQIILNTGGNMDITRDWLGIQIILNKLVVIWTLHVIGQVF